MYKQCSNRSEVTSDSQKIKGLSMDELAFRFDTSLSGALHVEDCICPASDSLAVKLSVERSRIKFGHLARPLNQVYSGNLAIDFSNPIAEGSIVALEGNKGTGKSTLALNICANYLNDFENCHVIILAINNSGASKFQSGLDSFRSKGYQSKGNYTIFVPKYPEQDSSVYINSIAAIQAAIDLKTKGKRVLVVMEDIEQPLISGLQIYKELGYPFVPSLSNLVK